MKISPSVYWAAFILAVMILAIVGIPAAMLIGAGKEVPGDVKAFILANGTLVIGFLFMPHSGDNGSKGGG